MLTARAASRPASQLRRRALWGPAVLVLVVFCANAAPGEVGARDKYVLFCAGCHGMQGEGGGGGGGMKRIFPFPPAIGVFLNDSQGRAYLANVGGVTSAGMSDAETAAVLNFILLSFGQSSLPKEFVPYTPEEIRGLRRSRVDDPLALRREIDQRLEKEGLELPPYEWD
jgi:hypothetical protein